MRFLSPDVLSHLSARGGQNAALLAWFEAKSYATGDVETIGFWTGADDQGFNVEGQNRAYLGAGGLIKIPPLVAEAGLNVRTTRLTFSGLAPEVHQAVQGYRINRAPCQLHIAYFHPVTQALIGIERVFKGRVAGASHRRAAAGGESTWEVSLRSSAVFLTISSPLKKSAAALQARAPGDRLRRYTDISGAVETVWGELRAAAPSPVTASAQPDATRESPNR